MGINLGGYLSTLAVCVYKIWRAKSFLFNIYFYRNLCLLVSFQSFACITISVGDWKSITLHQFDYIKQIYLCEE